MQEKFLAVRFVKVAVHWCNGESISERRAALQDVLDALGLSHLAAPMPPVWVHGEWTFAHEVIGELQDSKVPPRKFHKHTKHGGADRRMAHADKAQNLRPAGARSAQAAIDMLTPLLCIINKTCYPQQAHAIERALIKAAGTRRKENTLAYGVLMRRRHKRWLEKVQELARENGASKVELVELTTHDNLCSWLEFRASMRAHAVKTHQALLEANIDSTFIAYHHGHKGPAIRFKVPDAMLEEGAPS